MQKTLLSIGISIVYSILVTMLVDKMIGYEDNVEYYQNKQINNYSSNENDELVKKRYYILTLIGVLSIVCGNYIKEESISNGISLGGLFILIFHTLMNWFTINETSKIIVLSISLGALLYTGKTKKLF
jgi:predicted histidine transporter YuiF (NhaC family)|tara:strand:+ start:1086 stop:1469 length:384 start_codon:yes stop_codon:yes gene_type:complete